MRASSQLTAVEAADAREELDTTRAGPPPRRQLPIWDRRLSSEGDLANEEGMRACIENKILRP